MHVSLEEVGRSRMHASLENIIASLEVLPVTSNCLRVITTRVASLSTLCFAHILA